MATETVSGTVTLASGKGMWSARCLERGTPGAGGGIGKRIDGNADTAPDAYLTADNHPAASRCYWDALAIAAYCGDDELTAHTCLNMALQTITLAHHAKTNPDLAKRAVADPRTALRSTLRAADLTHRHSSGRIHALIAARQALAHAYLGEQADFDRTIGTAWREMDLAYDREPYDLTPDWLKFMCHNEIRYHEAAGLAQLGKASKSLALYTTVAEERSGKRNAAIYRARLASSLAQFGDIDEAVKSADATVGYLEDKRVSSARTVRILKPVREAASHAKHEEFRNRYDQLVSQGA